MPKPAITRCQCSGFSASARLPSNASDMSIAGSSSAETISTGHSSRGKNTMASTHSATSSRWMAVSAQPLALLPSLPTSGGSA